MVDRIGEGLEQWVHGGGARRSKVMGAAARDAGAGEINSPKGGVSMRKHS